MRIYVPATLDELDAVTVTTESARWTVAPRGAHAVTPVLAESFPDEDDEGLEFIAALEAADDSLALVAGRVGAPRLRLVVTVEVPDAAVEVVGEAQAADEEDVDAPAPSAVRVVSTVEDVAIVCVHVDETTAVADVEAVLAAADAEDDEALDAALDRITDRNLLWYDWSEISDVPRG